MLSINMHAAISVHADLESRIVVNLLLAEGTMVQMCCDVVLVLCSILGHKTIA